jgi:hypothetical protein
VHRLPRLLRCPVEGLLGRARVQDDDAEAVADDVVQFAGDAPSLGGGSRGHLLGTLLFDLGGALLRLGLTGAEPADGQSDTQRQA